MDFYKKKWIRLPNIIKSTVLLMCKLHGPQACAHTMACPACTPSGELAQTFQDSTSLLSTSLRAELPLSIQADGNSVPETWTEAAFGAMLTHLWLSLIKVLLKACPVVSLGLEARL